jgi:hypothetical protein
MRLVSLVFIGLLTAMPAVAQEAAQVAASTDPPVSLDRIRAGLERPTGIVLANPEPAADFRLHVLEQAKIDELIRALDFKSGPAVPGGLYAYQQQQLMNLSSSPLTRPYAAFSGPELVTLAIENLVGQWLAGHVVSGIKDAARARTERLAREDVAHSIAEYCAAREDRDDIVICSK